MVAVARNICTAKKHTSGAKNIYYLLSKLVKISGQKEE